MNQEYLANFLDSAVWGYGKGGAILSGTLALIASCIGSLVGGWDMAIKLLAYLMVVDVVLGVMAAMKAGKGNSNVAFWGGAKKVIVFVLVGLAAMIDPVLGLTEPYLRNMTIWFYIGREGLSLIENLGKLDVPFPESFKRAFIQISERSDSLDRINKRD